jgi:signal transduction histidine kinase
MSGAIRLHLFLVFGWLSTVGLLLHFVAPVITPGSLQFSLLVYLALPALWIASLVWRHRRMYRLPETRQFAMQYNLFAMWSQNIATVAIGWIILPQLDASWQPVASFYVLGTIAIEFVATVRPPPAKGRSSFAPLFLSASIIVYLAVQGGPVAIALIIYHAAFAYAMYVLRKILQRQSDRLHIAITQVQEERDAKSRFLASASHDLGQPLQSARLFFDQVVRGADPARRAKAAGQAEAAFAVIERQLHKMIEHLKLDSGDVTPRLTDVAVGPLIARLASLAEAQAAEAGVAIHALPSRLVVHADADLFERALSNFIDNAIHLTPLPLQEKETPPRA